MVKAVNGTVCWWYFVVFCLEKLRPDVYCWRKAMDPLVIMLKTWVLPDISKWMSKICRQLFPQLLSLTSLCCFLICTRWKMMASLIILLWRVDLMTIKSSLIVWWGLYKRDMEIIYTKQEMIWHGRQEVEPHIQQQDLREILHSFLFSCSSKSYTDSHLKSYIKPDNFFFLIFIFSLFWFFLHFKWSAYFMDICCSLRFTGRKIMYYLCKTLLKLHLKQILFTSEL